MLKVERNAEDAEAVPSRVAAISDLQVIARERVELHWPCMDALAAFVKSARPAAWPPPADLPPSRALTADVQAAIDALCQRPQRIRPNGAPPFELYFTDLRGARFNGGDLYHVYLKRCYLDDAWFKGARLEKTNFRGSLLMSAHFDDAILRETNFRECFMEGVEGISPLEYEQCILDDQTQLSEGVEASLSEKIKACRQSGTRYAPDSEE